MLYLLRSLFLSSKQETDMNIDSDQLNTNTNSQLIDLQRKLNKELQKRSGEQLNTLEAKLRKFVRSLNYDLVPLSLESQGADKPKRRGRRRKTEEQPPEEPQESQL
jgi:hypothetical protein